MTDEIKGFFFSLFVYSWLSFDCGRSEIRLCKFCKLELFISAFDINKYTKNREIIKS